MRKPTPDPLDGFAAAILISFTFGVCGGVALSIAIAYLVKL